MRPMKVTIDIDPHKIPDIVCCDHAHDGDSNCHRIAEAIAEALGIQDYLARPDRIYELRRLVWERGDSLSLLSVGDEAAPFEASAD